MRRGDRETSIIVQQFGAKGEKKGKAVVLGKHVDFITHSTISLVNRLFILTTLFAMVMTIER